MESRDWALLGILVFGSLFAFLKPFLERRDRRRSLSSRSSLPDHELSELFATTPEIAPAVLFILSEVAARLRVERGILRPDDTFQVLRGTSWPFETDLSEVGDLVGEFVPPDKFAAACKLETLGAFVVFVAGEAMRNWETVGPKK